MNNECQICSLDSIEHDRGMSLVHPLMRHAFVESFEKEAVSSIVDEVSRDPRGGGSSAGYDELAVARGVADRKVKQGELISSREFAADDLETIPAEKMQFRRLNQIAERLAVAAVRNKTKTTPDGAAMESLEGAGGLSEALQDDSEKNVEKRNKSLGELSIRLAPLRAAESKRWREAANKEFTGVMGLRHKKTGEIIEVYSDQNDRLHYLGPGERPTPHEQYETARSLDTGTTFDKLKKQVQHIWSHHRKNGHLGMEQEGTVQDRNGRDITIAREQDEPLRDIKEVIVDEDGPEVPEGVMLKPVRGKSAIDLSDPALTREEIEGLVDHHMTRQMGGIQSVLGMFKRLIDKHESLPQHLHDDEEDRSTFYDPDTTTRKLVSRTDRDLGIPVDPSIAIHNMISGHLEPNPHDPETEKPVSAPTQPAANKDSSK